MSFQGTINKAIGTMGGIIAAKSYIPSLKKAEEEAKTSYYNMAKMRDKFDNNFNIILKERSGEVGKINSAYREGVEAAREEMRKRNLERYNILYGGMENG